MSNFRRNLVVQAFDKIDDKKVGVISIEDLFQNFKGANHPEVRRGMRKQEVIEKEFFDCLESFMELKEKLV